MRVRTLVRVRARAQVRVPVRVRVPSHRVRRVCVCVGACPGACKAAAWAQQRAPPGGTSSSSWCGRRVLGDNEEGRADNGYWANWTNVWHHMAGCGEELVAVIRV